MAFSASFLSLLVAVTTLGYATPLTGDPLPQEVYWNTVLPTTPMPSVLRRLLHSGIKNPYVLEEESGKDVVWHMEGCILGSYIRGKVEAIWGDHSERLLADNANADDYLLYDDLRPGTNITLHVLASTARSGFLPRRDATSDIPFSLAELPKILARFSVRSPGSVEAKVIETSLAVCDGLADGTGDRARCATSLESMVEFAIAKMGSSNLTATSTMAMKEIMSPEKKKEQTYRIVGVRRMGGEKGVVCHPMPYPYAVYYCHLIREPTAVAFEVAAVGEDGTVVDAVAACHVHTGGWNGKHVPVLVLGKPRAPAVCHFLSKDNVFFWAPA